MLVFINYACVILYNYSHNLFIDTPNILFHTYIIFMTMKSGCVHYLHNRINNKTVLEMPCMRELHASCWEQMCGEQRQVLVKIHNIGC